MSNEDRKLDERVDMVGPILAARAEGAYIMVDEQAEAFAKIQAEDDEFIRQKEAKYNESSHAHMAHDQQRTC